MIIFIINLSAALFYLASLSLLWRALIKRDPVNCSQLTLISIVASTAHLIGAALLIFVGPLLDLSVFSSGSLIFALSSLIISLSTIRKPIHAILLVIQPIAVLLIALSLISEPTKLISVNTAVSLHIIFSITAYGVITIAAALALLMSYASYRLKHKQIKETAAIMPSLETIDRLLFEMILCGELLLSASIVSGFLFVDNFFGQQLALSGRHLFGWRGTRAIKLTIAGFITLFFAYVGSKLVLELILN